MASATRLPIKTVGFTIVLIASASASRINVRKLLLRTFTGPGSYSRIAATILLLLNLKNVPFAWHFRVFKAMLQHCLLSPPSIPPSQRPSTLFLPVITTSSSPFWECDYNLHKSNSTYFSDLDVTRSHLICALLQPGIHKLHNNASYKLVLDPQGRVVTKRWNIMLGSVMCSFKREIPGLRSYEMWSRILCWDRKWIYVVTHFVKVGVVRPKGYVVGGEGWFGGRNGREGNGDGDAVLDEKNIYASAISKYVVKLGRLTVHPEVLLDASGVLPTRPGGWHTMSGVSGESTPETLEGEAESLEVAKENAKENASEVEEADWQKVEGENKRGMEFALHFQALDGLHDEFSGSRGKALGKFRDFLL